MRLLSAYIQCNFPAQILALFQQFKTRQSQKRQVDLDGYCEEEQEVASKITPHQSSDIEGKSLATNTLNC